MQTGWQDDFFERDCLFFGNKQTYVISILTDGNFSMKNAYSFNGFNLHRHSMSLQEAVMKGLDVLYPHFLNG